MKVNPEFLPLIEWWEKDGKSTVIWLLVAAAAVGGWYGFKAYKASVKAAASAALVSAYTTDELEEASEKFASSQAGGAIKLRLAKSYYDNSRFEEAMALYDELSAAVPAGFEDVPPVGKAQCLEALGRYADAQKAYEDFLAANPKSFLALTAGLGVARTIALKGDKAAALKRIEELKAANSDEIAKARIETTESAIKRYGKKASAAPAKPAAAPAKPAAAPAKPAAAAKEKK